METPAEVSERFPEAAAQLTQYAEILTGPGIERGLIGPREGQRIWQRHILNCAAVVEDSTGLMPAGASVIDVGSGAGLPGIVWAITRPDLTVTLIESLARRVEFLEFARAELGLTERVNVLRSRAEDAVGAVSADVVTARAVAPLARLIPWTVPLVKDGGAVLALKGSSVEEEIRDAAPELSKYGAGSVEVVHCGDWLEDPTVVARISGFATRRGGRSAHHRSR